MASQFSDPAWWPKPPPQPPKPISMTKIVFGTLLPVAALIVGGILVFNQHTSSASSTRSIAAFDDCLKAHGYEPGRTDSSQTSAAVRACRNKLPPGTQLPRSGGNSRGGNAQAFNDCIRSSTAGLGRGGFSALDRQKFEEAIEVCRALVQGSGSGSAPPPTTTTTSTSSAPSI